MKQFIPLFTIIILLLLVCGCSQPQSQPQPQQQTPVPLTTTHTTTFTPLETPTTVTVAPTKTASVSANTIVIQNMAYDPATLTVAVGSIVRWVNKDDVPHTVTFTKESGISCGTGIISPSQSCSAKFDRPGTYDYSCAMYPSMHGTIVVQ
jgi:plastocyanin